MVYNLRSNDLSVKINSKGAEISCVVKNNVEYIWQADPDVWARHTPVLFPIVGRLKENKFTYKGRSYSLPQHGFARDMEFTCIRQKETEISFELQSNVDTRTNFPFDFSFVINYKLKDDSVICSYTVSNPSPDPLYFSIGAHPGFRTDDINNCILRFATDQYEITLLKDGLLSEQKERLHCLNRELPLNTSLFERDALVFENTQVEVIELLSSNGNGVELRCKGWPFFGVWSKKGSKGFVCLEPWHGITDPVDAHGDIAQKKGIIELQGGKNFECSFEMRFF